MRHSEVVNCCRFMGLCVLMKPWRSYHYFVLMSRRSKDDYIAVLQKTRDILGEHISVEGFVLDFEAAAWSAIRVVFPNAGIKGCCFHWCQAVLRHVQSTGFGPAFMERKSIWEYIKKLLALPFLPSNHIRPVSESLAAKANTDQLCQLVNYIRSTWIDPTHSPFRTGLSTNTQSEPTMMLKGFIADSMGM
ncbi:uncharacterized protein LOC132758261 [Ruditapes philippinarum]|uniref:uncharacterized protein LOC132758261 n=1 Tax=Ruditapes philippinarum TaxID=129788 RepID=UPI00295BB39A|nr:uncharacterized protein LOC132758261 [Ruditapes philippinarum]